MKVSSAGETDNCKESLLNKEVLDMEETYWILLIWTMSFKEATSYATI